MPTMMEVETETPQLDPAGSRHARKLDVERTLRFRNYRPRDEGLRAQFEKTQRAVLYLQLEDGTTEEPKEVNDLNPFERALKEQIAKQDPSVVQIAPKKATWDLKRDIEKKLRKLERRTQRAIVEVLREKMAEEEEEEESGDDAEDDLE